ncbi:MAG: lanthionine synthetase C family protein, partial [Actinocatenispora sp.]
LALLAAAHLTGEQGWLEDAGRLADTLAERAEDDGTGLWWPAGDRQPLGYLHGSSGVGTFLTELGTRTDAPHLCRLGRRALAFDLAQGRERPNGGLGFGAYAEAPAFEPYVVRGGAGVGMAVARQLAATDEPRLAATLRRIVRGVGMPFAVNPGYFSGMAGIAEFLLDCRDVLPDEPAVEETLTRLVDQIMTLRCPGPDGTAFPGDGLLRQSCDLASGSAGIALTLRRLADGSGTLDLRYGRGAR